MSSSSLVSLTLLSLCILASAEQQCSASRLQLSYNLHSYRLQQQCTEPDNSQTAIATSNPLSCALLASRAGVTAAALMLNPPLLNVGMCRIVTAKCQRFSLVDETASPALTSLILVKSTEDYGFLLFAMKTGGGGKFWNLFAGADSAANSQQLLLMSGNVTLPDRFRCNLLDNMRSLVRALAYKQIIVSVYNSGQVLALKLVFNVSRLVDSIDRTNWFASNNLVYSWPDETLRSRSFNFFSIEGSTDYTLERRMFVNFVYNGCNGDKGLLMVVDDTTTSTECNWVKSPVDMQPRILYNAQPNDYWYLGVKYAERLAIFVR